MTEVIGGGGRRGTDYMLGSHAATLKLVLESQRGMQLDIAEIKTALSEKKGERRVGLWVAGAIGGLAASIFGMIVQPIFHLLVGK